MERMCVNRLALALLLDLPVTFTTLIPTTLITFPVQPGLTRTELAARPGHRQRRGDRSNANLANVAVSPGRSEAPASPDSGAD